MISHAASQGRASHLFDWRRYRRWIFITVAAFSAGHRGARNPLSAVIQSSPSRDRQVAAFRRSVVLLFGCRQRISFVERNLAPQLSAGAVSTLAYAMRLSTIPSNFLVAPLGIVVYPHLAREALLENRGNLRVKSPGFSEPFFLFSYR